MQRQKQLIDWLSSLYPNQTFTIAPASADASFRRYFRATFADGTTRVAMDAPPQHEDCRPFLHVGKLFEDAGTHVPHVYAQDLKQGFLLLSDLGNTTYLQALTQESATRLYGAATDALIQIQLASRENELPLYDEALLRRELNLFPEWYISRHLGVTLSAKQQAKLEEVFARILANNLAQPSVYVHRDYHSRNLMLIEKNNPGILDFQDAVFGPITYDLASLFKDAYIRWEEEEIMHWIILYWEKARKAGLPVREDFGEFYRDYEMMGVQRHIKVLGIFARLYHRDGKDGYLKDMPLVMDYLRLACERYIDLKPLLNILIELEMQAHQTGASI
ncbi:phosphotransferase [Sideroxydans sp. CL21]|uniref:aminoglycoside phosphotransferase family protein n=1 Tax=Sideroxydans sp. CL21 TaxID=2600596 RepID=UPI0012A997F3|nr:phosphotransferase [Sideroxydans sp. CL21]VVC85763.1 Phosphotransferase involved in threonylcarbamoyladenosine t(6)A37 formation in tRNA [Sideroxydans sp. CL21]